MTWKQAFLLELFRTCVIRPIMFVLFALLLTFTFKHYADDHDMTIRVTWIKNPTAVNQTTYVWRYATPCTGVYYRDRQETAQHSSEQEVLVDNAAMITPRSAQPYPLAAIHSIYTLS